MGERVAPRFTYSWKFGAGFCPAAGNRNQAFSQPGKTGAVRGPAPGTNRVRARRGEEKDTVRDLLGAAALEKLRSRAQLFGRFCALGNGWPHVLHIHGSLARAFARPQGTGDRLPACPGKQEPGVGLHMEPIAGVRDWAKPKTGCASCPAQPRGEEKDTVRVLLAAGARLARHSRAGEMTGEVQGV